jgi:alpha-L-rhamnosidase
VRPVPDPALTHASARHCTPYGWASVAWRRQDGQSTLNAEIPPGTRATVHLPGAEPMVVRHGATDGRGATSVTAQPLPARKGLG